MKQKTYSETKQVETVYYESDDGCFRSESEYKVLEYEGNVNKANPVYLSSIYYPDSWLGLWKIYRCETAYDFYKAIAIETKREHISYNDIVNEKTKYNSNIKVYAIQCEEATGDCYYGELTVEPVASLITSLKDEIKDTETYLENLTEDKETLEKYLEE